MENNKYLSVKALTKYLKYKFDQDPYLRRVFVTGELSNVKLHSSGHLYFALKDGHSVIRGIMFKSAAGKLTFEPVEGQKVLISGRVSIFENTGQYQIYAEDIQIDGVGQLFEQLERDKKELSEKGYFDQAHKKPIPEYPENIVMISSATSAAVRDMITTFKRRYPLVKLHVLNTLMQGSESKDDVIGQLSYADTLDADLIILARGGGSIEDLWTFNEKAVALAVFNTKTPVITGVGHETDTTLVDYISDLRAPTPTAAAELSVPFYQDIIQRLKETELQFTRDIMQNIQYKKQLLSGLADYYKFKTPSLLYDQQTERLINLKDKLVSNFNQSFKEHTYGLKHIQSSLNHLSPMPDINVHQNKLSGLYEDLNQSMIQINKNNRRSLLSKIEMLDSLSPTSVLKRGYSYTTKEGQVIKDTVNIKEDDLITSHFHRGNILSKVIEVKNDE
ncbi:exodeoxyribonuclease VII large subunit [Salinicoccus sp. YB14-2]|uniref:exodeoxyribonuclease VII large subunit n=1 Tax=Salinicoccus sp. YB14-2 TaxID=1572701 RepID=UPI00069186AF|nr:exodeoxyribonuclease VII large subunit [Salinicoccus sp. YB14-2]